MLTIFKLKHDRQTEFSDQLTAMVANTTPISRKPRSRAIVCIPLFRMESFASASGCKSDVVLAFLLQSINLILKF